MRNIILTTIFGVAAVAATAKTYELTPPQSWEPIRSEHLQMGGTAPDGGTIDVNNFYIIRDGKPTVAVCGEFHYTRYPADQWEQEILKMKAGGINVLPSYVFWSLHEPNEGEWVWTGNRDLHRFIELCKKHNMDVIIRIGPFGHGEIRNGAIPDWIFAKNLDIRSNDPKYLEYADKLYRQIARQLDGLYYKDGGPIIGCQIENEHQHSAAPMAVEYNGEPVRDFTAASYDKGITKLGVSVQDSAISTAKLGEEHMKTLLKMAQDAGIVTPFYTATGWGNAAVIEGKAIPVTSAYTYPTWFPDQRKSEFCMFKDLWHNPDYSPVRYNPVDYPSAAAEMGVGIQMVYDKRPICTPEAAEALMTPAGEGFLFLINTQDHDLGRHDQTDLQVKLNLPGGAVTIPATGGFTLPKNTSAILPFNFDMEGARLQYAVAQPLMEIDDNGTPHFFFTVHDGMKPEYVFDKNTVKGRSEFKNVVPGYKSTFTVKARNGKKIKITTLPYHEALNAMKVNGKLLVTDATVVPEKDGVKLLSLGSPTFRYVAYPSKQGFREQTVTVDSVAPELKVDKSVPCRMEVTFTGNAKDLPQVNEFFLNVPYTGDLAMAYLDNAMILDHFWQGEPWRIGLNRFAEKMSAGKPMGFYFRPLRHNVPFLQDIPADRIPSFADGPVLEIGTPAIIPEYTISLPSDIPFHYN